MEKIRKKEEKVKEENGLEEIKKMKNFNWKKKHFFLVKCVFI